MTRPLRVTLSGGAGEINSTRQSQKIGVAIRTGTANGIRQRSFLEHCESVTICNTLKEVHRRARQAQSRTYANPPTRPCENCGEPTPALRATKRFCSAACRQADSRRQRGQAGRQDHGGVP